MSIASFFGIGTRAVENGVNQVTGAIRQAAQSTGISFDYLLATARVPIPKKLAMDIGCPRTGHALGDAPAFAGAITLAKLW
jgi:hypothetical protein